MLDVLDFIKEKGGDPDLIKKSQKARFADEKIVDEVIELWERHRKTKYEATQFGSRINAVQKAIGQKKKAKQDADPELKQKADLEKEKRGVEDEANALNDELQKKIKSIGNLVHSSVPVGSNEDVDNVKIRDWAPEGAKVDKRDCLSHHEVLIRLQGYDPERGVKVVGHRGYFLTNYGVFLNQALINYGLEFLSQQYGYVPLQAPQFMLKHYMAKTAQLDAFDDELYKVVDGDSDKYLIATSEQPISAFHADEWLLDKELPIKYAGYSTCYRREAGAHGKDAWGIFRVHQFEKVEQFLITKPEDSWEALDSMIEISEKFYQSLALPYRVVAICSGALNNAAAKKFDLEAWFPFQGEYKELVSCSNCTEYQSRALEIRCGAKTQIDSRKKYAHALNGTLCATERALCCILENWQTEEGLVIPPPLRKYIPGNPEFLPFTAELPKDSTSTKAKGKTDVHPSNKPSIKQPAATHEKTAASGATTADQSEPTQVDPDVAGLKV